MTGPKRIVAWVGLVLLILLGLFEGTARLMTVGSGDVGAIIPDPHLGWRLASDHAGEMADVRIDSDSHGVRVAGPAVPATGSAQAGQVVWLMGDSFTFGWGLEWADTVAARLAERMPPGSAVYNLGVPGYGLTQSLLRLRREESLPQPNIIILLANPMDIVEDTLPTSLVYERPAPTCVTQAQEPCEVGTPGGLHWALWTGSAAYRTARFMLESSLHRGAPIPDGAGLGTALQAFQSAAEARGAVLLPVLHTPRRWDGFGEMVEGESTRGWLNITRMLDVLSGGEDITLADKIHWSAPTSHTVARLLRAALGRHLEVLRGPADCSGWRCQEDEHGRWSRTRTVTNAAGEPLTLSQRYVPPGPGVMGSEEEDLRSAIASIGRVYGAPEAQPKDGIPSTFRDFFLNETPPQVVHLDGYWIDVTEVTHAAFAWSQPPGTQTVAETRGFEHAYRGRGEFDSRKGGSWRTPTWPGTLPGNLGPLPVTSVTWEEARTHCQALKLDLPTGAQWERAARGPDGRRYPWGQGDPTCELANAGYFPNKDFCEQRPVTVGSSPGGQSIYGALDMAGNVWEWVRDCRTDRYDWMSGVEAFSGLPANPEPPEEAWSDGCASRILRGGSWAFGYDAYLRPAARAFESGEAMAEWSLGFRCASP